MDRDGVEVKLNTEKERGHYPSILTKQASVINAGFII